MTRGALSSNVAMPFSPVQPHRPFLRGLVVAVLGGVFLATSEAFGGASTPYPQRLLFWITLMISGGLVGHLCSWVIRQFIDVDDRPWLAVVLLTLAITGPMGVVVWAATGLFSDQTLSPISRLTGLLWPVALVTAGAVAINVFLGRETAVLTHVAPPSSSVPPRFLQRLPMKLRGATIYAVQAEDHYLRVHTDRGSDLILMRLSQAVEELDGLEGARTHRSWWVARKAVRSVERGDGRATLTLENGLKIPASRRYARVLRGAGWW